MKRTGPTKNSTRLLVRKLEKASIERKQKVWKSIARLLEKPRRRRSQVNLEKLGRLGKKFKGKTFVIAGKILGKGNLEEKISIAALEWSQSAFKKISENKGSIVSIQKIVEEKEKPSQIMIVK